MKRRSLGSILRWLPAFLALSFSSMHAQVVESMGGSPTIALRQLWLKNGADVRSALDALSVSTATDWFDRALGALTAFQISVRARQMDRALSYWDRFANYYPMRQVGFYELGRMYAESKQYHEAIRMLSGSLADDARFIEARRERANILEKLGDYRGAAADYRMLSVLIPSDTIAARNALAMDRRAKEGFVSEPLPTTAPSAAPAILPWTPAISTGPDMAIGISTADNGNLIPVTSFRFTVATDFHIVCRDGRLLRSFRGGADRSYDVLFKTAAGRLIIHPVGHPESVTMPLAGFRIVPSTFSMVNIVTMSTPRKMIRTQRTYRGILEVLPYRGNRLILVNRIPMDTYLLSVLPAEIGADKPLEALKAQAVAARSYAWYARGSSFHKTFHLCCGQHCQVYRGVAGENESVKQAVAETAGEILVYRACPVAAFYHANCGGMTHNGAETGWSSAPYLRGVLDGDLPALRLDDEPSLYRWYLTTGPYYSAPSRYTRPGQFRWVRVVSRRELCKHLNRFLKIGELGSITVTRRSSTGLVMGVRLKGSYRSKQVAYSINKEHLIRAYLAPGGIRSASFLVEYSKPDEAYYFWGAGWGHGMGMCQSGACSLAEKGKNYVDILYHYYPGVEISRCYGSPVSNHACSLVTRTELSGTNTEDGELIPLEFGDEIEAVAQEAVGPN